MFSSCRVYMFLVGAQPRWVSHATSTGTLKRSWSYPTLSMRSPGSPAFAHRSDDCAKCSLPPCSLSRTVLHSDLVLLLGIVHTRTPSHGVSNFSEIPVHKPCGTGRTVICAAVQPGPTRQIQEDGFPSDCSIHRTGLTLSRKEEI